MAGGITLNPGVGGKTLNTDSVAGLDTQLVKLDNAALGNPSTVAGNAVNPLVVGGTVAITTSAPLPVSGSIEVQDGSGKPLTSIVAGAQQALAIAIVDKNGTQISTFSGTGGTAAIDGSVFTPGVSQETPVGLLAQSAPAARTAGQVGVATSDLNGNLNVNFAAGGAAVGIAGTPSADVVTVQGAAAGVPLNVNVSPAGGYSNEIAPATPAVVTAKASAGEVNSLIAMNLNAAPVYLKVWDTSSAPTLGSTAATYQFLVPGNTGGAGFSLALPAPRTHTHGIYYAVTGAISLTDNTSIVANSVIVDMSYT